MELKRVLGKDNRQAMEDVVRLYGPDALVVSGHKVNGKFELVVAVDIAPDDSLIDVPDEQLILDEPKSPALAAKEHKTGFKTVLHGNDSVSSTESTPNHESIRAQEIVELFRDEIQVLKREIQETRKASAWHMQMASPNGLNEWQQGLMEHAIPSRLKTLLIDAIAETKDREDAEAQLHSILTDGFETVSELPEDISGTHAFFGPTGAGKTTLIGKLAKTAADRVGSDRIAIISYADQKLGAWNQMQLMASQLGVNCFKANSPDMLRTVLRESADYECILIDTSGVDIARHHAEVTQYAPEALIHLVVASEVSRSSVQRLFNDEMQWDSVNVTKLDESCDSWVLIDTLMQNSDSHLWLQSASEAINKPATIVNTSKWVASMLETIELKVDVSETEIEAAIEGRQTTQSVSTLDFLTGLRATKSERNTQPEQLQNPAF